MRTHIIFAELVLSVCVALCAPFISYAQSAPIADELHTSILSTLLTDSRTANMTPNQLTQLVDALANEARNRSLGASDIRAMIRTSIPGAAIVLGPAPEAPKVVEECGMFPSLCFLNDAFGFDGSNFTIVVWFIFALVMVFVFVLKIRHHHHEEHGTTPAPPWSITK